MDIQLIDHAQNGLFQATNPELLAKDHPLWANDLEKWGPWAAVTGSGPSEKAWISPQKATGRIVYIFGHSVSSLDVGWHLVERDCLFPWGSVLAACQWGGRGQLRRAWTSPAGNIYATLCIPWPPGDTALSKDLAAMVTAYAIIRSFEQMGIRPELKWPNDLLLNGKIGGILIEERQNTLLAGIGINIASAPDTVCPEDLRPARLSDFLPDKGPLSVWLELSQGIRHCFIRELAGLDQNAIIARMDSVLAWKGKKVRIVDKENKSNPLGAPCVLAGLAPTGGLLLKPCPTPAQHDAETLVVEEGSLVCME